MKIVSKNGITKTSGTITRSDKNSDRSTGPSNSPLKTNPKIKVAAYASIRITGKFFIHAPT